MRHISIAILVACVSLVPADAQPARGPEASSSALVDVVIVDPGRAFEQDGMTVLIEGETIRDVFPTGSRTIPPGTEIHDMEGRFLLPGLIDSHTHLTAMFHRKSPQWMREVLERMYYGGIVAMRDMAGDARLVAHIADLAAAGEMPAPEIYHSAVFGSPHFMQTDPRNARAGRGHPPGSAAWAQAVTTETDLPRAVTRAAALGVTGVKIYLGLTPELLRELTNEAHRQGLKVWAHSTVYPTRPLEVVRAGVDSISHACGLAWQDPRLDPSRFTEISILNRPRFDPELVDPEGAEMTALFEEMVRRGTILDATLSAHAASGDDRFGCTSELTAALARAARRAGVTFVAGTDYEAPRGDPYPSLLSELDLLVDQDVLTPREAIVAATATAARLLGLENRFGSIEPGRVASLVLLEDDPREGIGALRTVTHVVHRGRLSPRSAYAPPE